MAESDATLGFGSTIAYSELGTVFTDVAQTVDLPGPSPEIGDVKITNNDSPDNTHEYRPGLSEPGTLEFDLIYTKAQAAALYAMYGDGKVYFWKETLPDGSVWAFKGYLNKFGTETETEDKAITNSVGIKVTAKPTFTPAA